MSHPIKEPTAKELLAEDQPISKITKWWKNFKSRLLSSLTNIEEKEEKIALPSGSLIEAKIAEVLPDHRMLVTLASGERVCCGFNKFCRNEVETLKTIKKNLVGKRVGITLDSYEIQSFYPDQNLESSVSSFLYPRPEITFRDIGGLKDQIQKIKETILLSLERPKLFKTVGIVPPKGILLYGPPGTGKTLLAKAVANAANAKFMSLTGAELVDKYLGEGTKLVKQIFEYAKQQAPVIIFIDEIDSIAAKRSDSGQSSDGEVNRTLMQLLAEMDGFTALGKVKIIAATNRKDVLDSAILRPGRFDRIIEIPHPDITGRSRIFEIHTKHMPLDLDVSFKDFIQKPLSGAQIRAICQEAGMRAIRKKRTVIIQSDFTHALGVINNTSPLVPCSSSLPQRKNKAQARRSLLKAFAKVKTINTTPYNILH